MTLQCLVQMFATFLSIYMLKIQSKPLIHWNISVCLLRVRNSQFEERYLHPEFNLGGLSVELPTDTWGCLFFPIIHSF